MKKILVLTMAIIMVLALCACGGNTELNEVTIDEYVDFMVTNYYGEEYTANIEDTKYLSDGEAVYLIHISGPEGYLWSDDEMVTTQGALETYYNVNGQMSHYEYENEDEIYALAEEWINEW